MIPDRLTDYELIKVCQPDCEVDLHGDCNNPGKRLVGSTITGPFYNSNDPELRRWVEDGGNVGIPLNHPIVVFDVDHEDFGQLLSDRLPPTFTVRTGSGFDHRYYHAPDWDKDPIRFTVGGQEFGSLRTKNWQAVIPPSIHPETGDRYEVKENRQITSVGQDELASVVKAAKDRWIVGLRPANTPSDHRYHQAASRRWIEPIPHQPVVILPVLSNRLNPDVDPIRPVRGVRRSDQFGTPHVLDRLDDRSVFPFHRDLRGDEGVAAGRFRGSDVSERGPIPRASEIDRDRVRMRTLPSGGGKRRNRRFVGS